MKVLSRLGNQRRGLSNIFAYVLLISITLALSVMVYGWLRFYVTPDDVDECSEDVNIIIRSYECFTDGGPGSNLQVTLKNKGLFTVDGYILRVHNRTDADFGIYVFNKTGMSMLPGSEHTDIYYFDDAKVVANAGTTLKSVSLVEVQPFMMEGGKISCKSYAFQEVECLS